MYHEKHNIQTGNLYSQQLKLQWRSKHSSVVLGRRGEISEHADFGDNYLNQIKQIENTTSAQGRTEGQVKFG